MSSQATQYLITGANGQLGRLVIASLLKKVAASQIVATVRKADSVADLAALGVDVREADYDDVGSLVKAYAGVDKMLLISSSELGKRAAQHANVIKAAQQAGVKLVAYTSVLHADGSALGLAAEHVETEKALAASGIASVVLRNGWYTENYMGFAPSALQYGALSGSAGDGRIASASRQDFADAAVAVLTSDADQAGKVYELAGDEAYTLTEWAAALSELSGKPVAYNNLAEGDFKAMLVQVGLPEPLAGLLANSDAGAAKGALFDDSKTLSGLIGRPTTSLKTVMAAALKA